MSFNKSSAVPLPHVPSEAESLMIQICIYNW